MSKSEKRSYLLRVRLTEEESELLSEQSKVQHRSMSEIVRMALDSFLKDFRTEQ